MKREYSKYLYYKIIFVVGFGFKQFQACNLDWFHSDLWWSASIIFESQFWLKCLLRGSRAVRAKRWWKWHWVTHVHWTFSLLHLAIEWETQKALHYLVILLSFILYPYPCLGKFFVKQVQAVLVMGDSNLNLYYSVTSNHTLNCNQTSHLCLFSKERSPGKL